MKCQICHASTVPLTTYPAGVYCSNADACIDRRCRRSTDPSPSELAFARALAQGHDLVSDPPVFSSVDRHTCRSCGRALLHSGSRNAYGSALNESCTRGAS